MRRRTKLILALRKYLIFFLLMSFVITCCMLLFLGQLQEATGLAYSDENIRTAAVLTFGNVVLLSLLCTVIDIVRRRYMVERPVREIIRAAEAIMGGDFSARIVLPGHRDPTDEFYQISTYLNRMAEELSGVETLRTDFIANVSHELKTPLSIIRNYGTLLGQPGLTDAARMEYAKAITDACGRLADLITNILKLNKLENQQIFPNMQTYDLTEQLCQSLLQFEPVWEEKHIELETDLPDAVSIHADAELLSLVWNNLLSNAFKFTPAGGHVSLSLRDMGDTVSVSVADTGCGIDPKTGTHIFEKFYQGDTSHAHQGNGLGLALVKRVVDILHGEIQVESAPGSGSVFTVTIRR